jgi:hypothetical protein
VTQRPRRSPWTRARLGVCRHLRQKLNWKPLRCLHAPNRRAGELPSRGGARWAKGGEGGHWRRSNRRTAARTANSWRVLGAVVSIHARDGGASPPPTATVLIPSAPKPAYSPVSKSRRLVYFGAESAAGSRELQRNRLRLMRWDGVVAWRVDRRAGRLDELRAELRERGLDAHGCGPPAPHDRRSPRPTLF